MGQVIDAINGFMMVGLRYAHIVLNVVAILFFCSASTSTAILAFRQKRIQPRWALVTIVAALVAAIGLVNYGIAFTFVLPGKSAAAGASVGTLASFVAGVESHAGGSTVSSWSLYSFYFKFAVFVLLLELLMKQVFDLYRESTSSRPRPVLKVVSSNAPVRSVPRSVVFSLVLSSIFMLSLLVVYHRELLAYVAAGMPIG